MEKKIPENYLEKVYAGFLAKCIGIRLGAPVEPAFWDMERIQKVYGMIDHYVKPYKTFAADDDSNGPAYFIRSLIDKAPDKELTPQDVADAWLNYAREGVGMFWWGGYGISTEHTAYLNLKKGIKAPVSGSIKQNGNIIAEQIGGQIFIDTFGLVNPCNPSKAAKYGEIAASVSHDGEGLLGARFFCAAISEAFSNDNVDEIIEVALSQIPEDSDYHKVARFVKSFYEKEPDDFRACTKAVLTEFNKSKYLGNCHIIPNAGVCFIALYYGNGDFSKTIEIACTCGEDTDCNAGNVATVLGVAKGLSVIPAKYRDPINDGIVLSGVSGYLNILDLPTFAKRIAILGYKLADEEVDEDLLESFKPGSLYFDFELPGSTHNFRVSDEALCQISHTDESCIGKGGLQLIYTALFRAQTCDVFYKTFFSRDDFSDERYIPVFSPLAVSGQTVKFELFSEQWAGLEKIGVHPYIHTINGTKQIVKYFYPEGNKWETVEFVIPDTNGEIIDQVGFVVEGSTNKKYTRDRGRLIIDNFEVSGDGNWTVDFSKQKVEFGSITPLSHSNVAWRKVGKTVQSLRNSESFSYTGNYYAKDQSIKLKVTPESGEQHMLGVRAKGLMRGYFAGFDKAGKISILKKDNKFITLAEADYSWSSGQSYEMSLVAKGSEISLFIDGKKVLVTNDASYDYGMVAFGSTTMGRTDFEDLRITQSV